MYCLELYVLSNGVCVRVTCIEDCMVCLEANTCIVCHKGFYLNSSMLCQVLPGSAIQPLARNCSSIKYCVSCAMSPVDSAAPTTPSYLICKYCMPGYQSNSNQTLCLPQVCQVANCMVCIPKYNTAMCMLCSQGYFLNSYFQCVPYILPSSSSSSPSPALSPSCNIYNCLYCSYNNSCTFCSPGYLPSNNICISSTTCSDPNCISCTQPSICVQC